MATPYNLVLIGKGNSGKSCLTIRYISDRFVEGYDPTLEDSYRKIIDIDEEPTVLDIYDTAGVHLVTERTYSQTEDFAMVRDSYIREGEGFIVVYAINSMETFQEVPNLIEHVKNIKDDREVSFVVVGTKADLEDEREVSTQQGADLAESMQLKFFETSAKTGANVEEAFEQLVRLVKGVRVREALLHPPKKEKKKCTIL